MGDIVQVEPRAVAPVMCHFQGGAIVSDPVDTEGYEICGVACPASFAGTTMTIRAAEKENGTYQDVIDEQTGALVSIKVNANQTTLIPGNHVGIGLLRWLKFVSNSNQPANTVAHVFLLRKHGA